MLEILLTKEGSIREGPIQHKDVRKPEVLQHLMCLILPRQKTLRDQRGVAPILTRHEQLHTGFLGRLSQGNLDGKSTTAEGADDDLDTLEGGDDARFGGVVD